MLQKSSSLDTIFSSGVPFFGRFDGLFSDSDLNNLTRHARKLITNGILKSIFSLSIIIFGLAFPNMGTGLIITIFIISLLNLFSLTRDLLIRGFRLLSAIKTHGAAMTEITGRAELRSITYDIEINSQPYYCTFPRKKFEKKDGVPGFSRVWVNDNINDGDIVKIKVLGSFLIEAQVIEKRKSLNKKRAEQ